MSSKTKNKWLDRIAIRQSSALRNFLSIVNETRATLFPPLFNQKKWTKEIPIKGYDRSDIDIELDGKFLIISARKSKENRQQQYRSFNPNEAICSSYRFKRTFGLPFAPKEKEVKVKFKDNYIRIEIPYPKHQTKLAWSN